MVISAAPLGRDLWNTATGGCASLTPGYAPSPRWANTLTPKYAVRGGRYPDHPVTLFVNLRLFYGVLLSVVVRVDHNVQDRLSGS
jgi:hypothetical protein